MREEMTELFYQNAYIKEFEAEVLSCKATDKGYEVILSDTAFYPEGGGQICDIGTLNGVEVYDTRRKDGEVIHYTKEPIEGKVTGKINWEKRFDHMQQHSGEHIFSGIVHKLYGYENIGFHMGEDLITLDFSGVLDADQLKKVETLSNQKVMENVEIVETYPTKEELDELDFRSKKELKGKVRIITVPGADVCACCGTHVKRTGEVGLIKVISSINKKDGTRVQILCGNRALNYIQKISEENKEVSRLLSAKPEETSSAVSRLQEECASLKMKLATLVKAQLENRISGFKEYQKFYLTFEENVEMNDLRRFINDLVEQKKCGTACGLVFNKGVYNYLIISSEVDMKPLGKQLNSALNGRGGGNSLMLQGSFNATKEEIEKVLNEAFK